MMLEHDASHAGAAGSQAPAEVAAAPAQGSSQAKDDRSEEAIRRALLCSFPPESLQSASKVTLLFSWVEAKVAMPNAIARRLV
jgi:hypothetical protein